jgi:TP901 family phage tail tape measure protein
MEAARLFVTVGANTRSAEAGLKSFNDKLKNAARSMTTTGTAMTVGLTAPLMAVAGAALKSAGDFEQSMNILQQVTGASTDTMADLQEQALALGASTVFSAGEAAEGMLELAKAGMTTEQVMAAIPGVMSLAAAANVGLGEAAGITAAAINAFGLEASEATRVADMLAAGANASAADITDLAAGLQQAGFAFDMANQPIENLIASLAILTNVGLTGSDAGTALKNAFMRMMNPTQEALDLMNQLGISFYDAQGNMQALPAIIDTLNAALSGLTPQQRDAALATIFMSDGMKAMIPLLDAGSSGFNDMVGNVTQVGAATDVAGARMQGMAGAIEYLKGSVDSFLIGAALPSLDTLGGLARGAADALTRFGALPQPIINTSLAIAGIVAATGPVLVILGTLAGALSAIGPVVAGVVVAVAALGAAWAADIGGIQSITATVAGQVQQGFSQMLAGAQQLAAGIGAAFSKTSFPSLETLFAQFQAGDFQTIADTIRTTAFELMVNLDAELNITAQANELKGRLLEVVNGLGAAISQIALPSLGEMDWSALSIDTAGLLNRVSTVINNIDWTSVGAGLGAALVSAVKTGVGAVGWAAQFFFSLGQDLAVALSTVEWGQLDAAFVGLADAIRNALGAIGRGMMTEIGPAFAGVNEAFSARMESLGATIRGSFSNIEVSWDWGTGPDWDAIIPSLNWDDYTVSLDWGTLAEPIAWPEFITNIDWLTYVPTLNWGDWVESINWGSFVPDIEWGGFVPEMGWGDFIPTLDWGRFISWLAIPGFANGTMSAPGGAAIVGERGPELVLLPHGSRVYDNEETRAMASGMTVNINVASLNSDIDIASIAMKVAREIARRSR